MAKSMRDTERMNVVSVGPNLPTVKGQEHAEAR